MRTALWGSGVLALYLVTGWPWLLFTGLGIMLWGCMFDYQRPQDDPVYQRLVQDGVIGDDEYPAGKPH